MPLLKVAIDGAYQAEARADAKSARVYRYRVLALMQRGDAASVYIQRNLGAKRRAWLMAFLQGTRYD